MLTGDLYWLRPVATEIHCFLLQQIKPKLSGHCFLLTSERLVHCMTLPSVFFIPHCLQVGTERSSILDKLLVHRDLAQHALGLLLTINCFS